MSVHCSQHDRDWGFMIIRDLGPKMAEVGKEELLIFLG